MTVQLKTEPYTAEITDFSSTIAQAEKLIIAKGGRFTLIRKHIYQILLTAPHPLGAYEIIDQLNGIGSQKPPTVYRALTWLMDHGLAAKISFNATYTAIPVGSVVDDLAFVICRECGDTDVLEAPGLSQSLHQRAHERGFGETHMVMEIIGLCGSHKSGDLR